MYSVLCSNLRLKFGQSEKATKFKKNLPLKICRYWLASNFRWKISFQILLLSQNIRTFIKGKAWLTWTFFGVHLLRTSAASWSWISIDWKMGLTRKIWVLSKLWGAEHLSSVRTWVGRDNGRLWQCRPCTYPGRRRVRARRPHQTIVVIHNRYLWMRHWRAKQ